MSDSIESMYRAMCRFARQLLFVALSGMAPTSVWAERPIEVTRVAENVYAFVGVNAEIAQENRGFVGNSGFLVGSTGVVVVNTGISAMHGRRMLAAIARVTDRPVVLVIITHAIQEFLFGNAAFEERGIPILAHEETEKLMRARCEHCLQALLPLLGDELRGTRLVLPGTRISIGGPLEAGGRKLEILHFGWASTPGDIAVLDRESGTLFSGGLVATGRIPEIRDADFDGWQRALQALRKLPVRHLVPGYGPISGPQAIAGTQDYLLALDHRIRDLYGKNTSLIETLEAAELPAFANRAMYTQIHRRNVQHRYLQLEIEDLGGDPRSTALPQ
ncbi:MAG: MBL fold metallo-hydrolase [Burkholderiales bacterium]